MNVLVITHEKEINGASKSLLNLIDELSDRNTFFAVTPFCDGEMTEELKKRGIRIFCHNIKFWRRRKPQSRVKWILIKIKWFLINRFINAREAKRICKEIENLSIDLIHTNVSTLNVGGLVSKYTGIAHLWYIREFGEEDFGLYPVCPRRFFYHFIDRYSNAVVVVSDALKKKYEPFFHKTRLLRIYNGVGPENIIRNKTFPEKNTQIRFVIAGAICEGKGQKVAIEAAEELLGRGITNFHLFLAGRGESESLRSLFRYEEQYVTFLGQVSGMTELRKKMHVELVCSRSEAFGRVTVEAMMGAMPVIGSDSGGTPELIDDGKTGFLFRQGDFKELADRMQYFIEQPEEIRRMGTEAQRRAADQYSIHRCAGDVERLYGELVNDRY